MVQTSYTSNKVIIDIINFTAILIINDELMDFALAGTRSRSSESLPMAAGSAMGDGARKGPGKHLNFLLTQYITKFISLSPTASHVLHPKSFPRPQNLFTSTRNGNQGVTGAIKGKAKGLLFPPRSN